MSIVDYLLDSVAVATSLVNRGDRKAIDMSTAPETVLAYFDKTRKQSGTQSPILSYYNKIPGLRSVTSRVADDIGSLNWELYVGRDRGKAVRRRNLQRATNTQTDRRRDRLLKAAIKNQEAEAILKHPALDMLDAGNGHHTGPEVLKLIQLYMDHRGESFTQIKVGGGGLPESLWPLHPNWIKDVPSTPNGFFEVQVQGGRGSKGIKIPQSQMIWIKDPNPDNPYGRSIGLGETLGDELETNEYAARYIKTFFTNGAVPDGFVSIEGAKAERIKELEQEWNNQMQGYNKAHRMRFTNGKVDAKLLSHTFRDQEIVNLRMFQRDLVTQTFNIPPEIVGIIENSNRATIDAALFLYAIGVLVPRAERIRAALQRDLLPLWDANLILDYESPVPEDHEYIKAVMQGNKGAYTRAEHRDLVGLESHGDVDDVYVMSPQDIERPVNDPEFFSIEESTDPTAVDDADPTDGKMFAGIVKAPTLADVDNVLVAMTPDYLDVETGPVMEQRMQAWAKIKAAELGIEANFDLLNPLFAEHLREFSSTKITRVNETTKERVRKLLSEGVAVGEGADDLAARLDVVFGNAARSRSTTIARTEVTHSSNFGTHKVFETSGLVPRKQWVSTPDDRTRAYAEGDDFDHTTAGNLDGQIKALDLEFVDDQGLTAMYPGDFQDAGHVINCRCTIVALTTEDDEKGYNGFARKAIWDQYKAARDPWEASLKRALARGFRKQQQATMRALRNTLRE